MTLEGVKVNSGLAISKALVYRHRDVPVDHTPLVREAAEGERVRYETAKKALLSELERLDDAKGEERAILESYKAFLDDPDFGEMIRDYIDNHSHSAEWAVEAASNTYIALLKGSENEIIRDRAQDLEDLKMRLIAKITGRSFSLTIESDLILVADYLLLSELFFLDTSHVKGIALEKGGRTSHVAILARSLNVPLVTGISDLTKNARDGDEVILDGISGFVIIHPTREEVASSRQKLREAARRRRELDRNASLPAVTKDGHPVLIKANVEGLEGVDYAVALGAEGVGLFRTEFIFFRRELLDDDERREEIYREAVEKMKGIGRVTFRTLDVGGDKAIEGLETENTPFSMGMRSIRYCMANKAIFRPQLISILKASAYGEAALMFPMITNREELEEVLAYLEDVKAELRYSGVPFDEKIKVGTMIEVPSAAITSDIIAPMVDFMSVGTNDLIQFTMASERGRSELREIAYPIQPALIRLLRHVVLAARSANIPAALCGEMAGVREFLPLLVGLGFDELSMSPSAVLEAKDRIRSLNYLECMGLTERLLSMKDKKEMRAELKRFNDERDPRH